MAAARSNVCLWCGRVFAPRRGGSPQRFCSPEHRTRFWGAARQWAEHAVTAGMLTINDLKNGPGAACTLVARVEQPSPLPDIGSADPALLAALRRLGWAVLRVPIAPEGIAELVHLGWLDRRQCRQPAVLVDVLIDLANAALDAGLHPERR